MHKAVGKSGALKYVVVLMGYSQMGSADLLNGVQGVGGSNPLAPTRPVFVHDKRNLVRAVAERGDVDRQHSARELPRASVESRASCLRKVNGLYVLSFQDESPEAFSEN